MNLLPAELDGDTLKLPMVDAHAARRAEGPLGPGRRPGKQLVAGIRPEHFEDASLVSDPDAPGATFTTKIDVIEWMGAELFVHFSVEGSAHADLADLAEELETLDLGGGDEAEVVGRLDIHSEAKEGADVELWVDARQIKLFDADGGANLTREATAR